MSGFDYANARLKAMKGRLLAPEALGALANSPGVPDFMSALATTPYRQALESARVQFEGMRAINHALHLDLSQALATIRGFFVDRESLLFEQVVGHYDVLDLKCVLRGLARQVPADEILASTYGIGSLTPTDLAALARAGSVREAIDLLVTWREPIGRPLLELPPGRKPELFQMEMALEEWYFVSTRSLRGSGTRALHESAVTRVDANNILTALRLVQVEETADFLRRHYGHEDRQVLFIGPGDLPTDLLQEAAGQDSVAQAAERLARGRYRQAMLAALERYRQSRRLLAFEEALTQLQLRQAAAYLIQDPHGIGVLIGYLSLKTAEISNLRRIAQGLRLGQMPDQIRAELQLETPA